MIQLKNKMYNSDVKLKMLKTFCIEGAVFVLKYIQGLQGLLSYNHISLYDTFI